MRESRPRRAAGIGLEWLGIVLIVVAVVTAAALLVRDSRSAPARNPQPTIQQVIPAATSGGVEIEPAAIVPNPAFADTVICLDAAHGGDDRGFQRVGDAIAPAMDESLYTAAYARDLAQRLEAMGFTVVLTRDGDAGRNAESQDVNRDGQTRLTGATPAEAERFGAMDEMQARIAFCNDADADALISIHFDGSSDPNEHGTAIWYADRRADSAASQRLAETIAAQVGNALQSVGIQTGSRGAVPESVASMDGNLMVYDSLYMITGERDGLREPSEMPGVVVDLLTISHSGDAQVIASEASRVVLVDALAQALAAYFQPAAG